MTQTKCSYERQLVPISTEIIEQFLSDDSLKCYHYTVDIQKILNGEGAHPRPHTPPQTPPSARRFAPSLATFGRSFTVPPKPRTKSPPMAVDLQMMYSFKAVS